MDITTLINSFSYAELDMLEAGIQKRKALMRLFRVPTPKSFPLVTPDIKELNYIINVAYILFIVEFEEKSPKTISVNDPLFESKEIKEILLDMVKDLLREYTQNDLDVLFKYMKNNHLTCRLYNHKEFLNLVNSGYTYKIKDDFC